MWQTSRHNVRFIDVLDGGIARWEQEVRPCFHPLGGDLARLTTGDGRDILCASAKGSVSRGRWSHNPSTAPMKAEFAILLRFSMPDLPPLRTLCRSLLRLP